MQSLWLSITEIKGMEKMFNSDGVGKDERISSGDYLDKIYYNVAY